MARNEEDKQRDWDEERKEREFQNRVEAKHQKFLKMLSSSFLVEELKELLKMPHSLPYNPLRYSLEDEKFLDNLDGIIRKRQGLVRYRRAFRGH